MIGDTIDRMREMTPPRVHAAITGFGIAFLAALFVRYGVAFVLYMLDFWQVSILNTIILYALLFILARIGIKVWDRRWHPKRTRKRTHEVEGESRAFDPFTAVWIGFAVFSVLWLTPALIVFWIYEPPYPKALILLFVYIFSFAAAYAYYFENDQKFRTIRLRIIFFLSALLGAATVVNVLP